MVIGQEIFGVNANMRAVADLYAEEGYVALVPDLFWRLRRASTWATTKRPSPRPSSCSSASTWTPRWTTSPPYREHLRQREEVVHAGIGFVGFCMGGKLAYLAATRPTSPAGGLLRAWASRRCSTRRNRSRAGWCCISAEQDAYCPQQARDVILPCLRNLPKTELYLYPGVDHAFVGVGGMHFDKPPT
ncbi:dienelactone hydrolase family protein [Pseudomonas aeruginosa]|nr:dienelactone hydrolase family protein [Pseudomonas aeruginosa]